jgi:hypothetical protein
VVPKAVTIGFFARWWPCSAHVNETLEPNQTTLQGERADMTRILRMVNNMILRSEVTAHSQVNTNFIKVEWRGCGVDDLPSGRHGLACRGVC